MLKFDLHTHSLASGHAFNTIFELASYAKKNGVEVLGITDHGPRMQGAPHLGYFEMLRYVPKEINGVKIITGCEANIIDLDGKIDLPVNYQKEMDLVMIGLHERTPFPKNTNIAQNTEAIVKAIQKNKVHVIVHPYRPEFPVDTKKICEIAAKTKVLLELNLSLLHRPFVSKDLIKEICLMLKMVAVNNGKIIVSSDAHIATAIGDDSILDKFGLKVPPDMILGNQKGYQEIKKFLKSK